MQQKGFIRPSTRERETTAPRGKGERVTEVDVTRRAATIPSVLVARHARLRGGAGEREGPVTSNVILHPVTNYMLSRDFRQSANQGAQSCYPCTLITTGLHATKDSNPPGH